MMRDGQPALVSRQKSSVVLVRPASRQLQANGRPVFVIGINNFGKVPVDFRVAQVEASQRVGASEYAMQVVTFEMLQQIDARAAHLEKVEAEVREWEKQSAKTAEAELRSRAAQIANELIRSHAGEKFCVAEVKDGDGKLLQAVADTLKSKFDGPIFLVGATNGTVALVASVPKEMSVRVQANKLIQQVAPIVGGKGGGRPENAQNILC